MKVLVLLIAMCISVVSEKLRELEQESSLELKLSKHQLVMDKETVILLDGKRVTLEYFTENSRNVTISEIKIARDGSTVLRIIATIERK